MKPFLGIDLTFNKKNELQNGSELIVAKPSVTLTQAFESGSKKTEEMIKRTKLPLPLYFIRFFCSVVIFGIIDYILDCIIENNAVFSVANKYIRLIILVAFVCIFIRLLLINMSVKKEKAVLESDEYDYLLSNMDDIRGRIYAELYVPDNAEDVDILSFGYKAKGDKIKMRETFFYSPTCTNTAFKAYANSRNLYLVGLNAKYSIPLSSIRAIRTVNKSVSVMGWNKKEAYNKGIYKQYNIICEDSVSFRFKPYYIVEFTYNNETWGIYIPCYELPAFEKLTGLQAQ